MFYQIIGKSTKYSPNTISMSNSRCTENYIQKALQQGFETSWVYEMLAENHERTEYHAFTENCTCTEEK